MLFACCGKLAEANSAWNLKGRTAVVTGGSKGIGRGVVEELLEQGCRVITCARDCGPLDSLLCEVNSQISSECVSSAQREEPGLPRLIALPLDVSTGEGVDALVACVEEHFQGRLDILVNNVGTNVRKVSSFYVCIFVCQVGVVSSSTVPVTTLSMCFRSLFFRSFL